MGWLRIIPPKGCQGIMVLSGSHTCHNSRSPWVSRSLGNSSGTRTHHPSLPGLLCLDWDGDVPHRHPLATSVWIIFGQSNPGAAGDAWKNSSCLERALDPAHATEGSQGGIVIPQKRDFFFFPKKLGYSGNNQRGNLRGGNRERKSPRAVEFLGKEAQRAIL